LTQFSDSRYGQNIGDIKINTAGVGMLFYTEDQGGINFQSGGTITSGGASAAVDGNQVYAGVTKYTFNAGIWFGDPFYCILGLGIQALQLEIGNTIYNAEWGEALSTAVVRAGVGYKLSKRFKIEVNIEGSRSKTYVGESQYGILSYTFN
jgi:hypothetical protein